MRQDISNRLEKRESSVHYQVQYFSVLKLGFQRRYFLISIIKGDT
jgi:hypothetical protein